MLAHAAELRPSAAGGTIFSALPRFATALIALAFVLIVSGYGLFSASAQALPGDLLYPVKRSAENIRLGVTSDSNRRESLEEEFERRRTDEVARLLFEGRLQPISFEGRVEDISGQDWVVAGIHVLLGEDTKIIGEIQLNDEIEVEGETRAQGFVFAHELHKRFMRLQGIVDRLTSDYISIDGNVLEISDESDFDDEITVGDLVEALAELGDDQSLTLLEVHLLEDDDQFEGEIDEVEPERGEFSGRVDSIGSASWVIEGRRVRIDLETDIDGDISVGDRVRVRTEQRGDSLWALDIDRLDDDSDDLETEDLTDDDIDESYDDSSQSDDDPDVDDDDTDDDGSDEDEHDDQDEHDQEEDDEDD
jgi:hypothetical protein